MAKTEKELTELRKRIDELNIELMTLTGEELQLVSGGLGSSEQGETANYTGSKSYK